MGATSEGFHLSANATGAEASPWRPRITITDDEILVRFHKRAHNPLLIDAGFAETNVPVPWLGCKTLCPLF